MRIALVSTFYYPRLRGGAEYTLHSHAETLAQLGVDVSVLSFHEGEKPERFRHNGVDCHALPVPNVSRCLDARRRASVAARALWHLIDIYNPVAGRLLERELRAISPDIVHTENLPGWSCAAWTAIRRLGLPHVQMLHDYQFTCPAATRFRSSCNCPRTCARCLPFAMLRRGFSKRVSHVVANSSYSRQLHKNLGFFPGAKVFDVIYGPVSRPPSDAAPISRADGNLRIGYLGRLHPTKGVEVLLEAFFRLGKPDAQLRIAGTGIADYEAGLRDKGRGEPIEFLGHLPAAQFLPTIDVLVVPSLSNEPMGRVVIEAASHGIPVIASAVGGIPELVLEGKTGWLFDAASASQLASLLEQMTPQRLQALRPNCVEWAKHFSPTVISNRWMQLYHGMLGDEIGRPRSAIGKSLSTASSC